MLKNGGILCNKRLTKKYKCLALQPGNTEAQIQKMFYGWRNQIF